MRWRGRVVERRKMKKTILVLYRNSLSDLPKLPVPVADFYCPLVFSGDASVVVMFIDVVDGRWIGMGNRDFSTHPAPAILYYLLLNVDFSLALLFYVVACMFSPIRSIRGCQARGHRVVIRLHRKTSRLRNGTLSAIPISDRGLRWLRARKPGLHRAMRVMVASGFPRVSLPQASHIPITTSQSPGASQPASLQKCLGRCN